MEIQASISNGLSPESSVAPLDIIYPNEADLYKPMLKQIEDNWIKEEGYDNSLVRLTAALGKRNTGGTWTRPDITAVAIQKFKFLRDSTFDVVSFEIKPRSGITVEAVFEALSHRLYTNRAFLILYISESDFDKQEREALRIRSLCEQHGIGLILAEKPDDYDTWVTRVRARRWDPDPRDLNDFIQRVFPPTDHDEIVKLTK